jgi:hypothetical protein
MKREVPPLIPRWPLLAVGLALILYFGHSLPAAMTITPGTGITPNSGMIHRIKLDWTSDGSGNVTQAITLNGVILRVATDPGATAPTDNYDLTAPDESGVDVFGGQGANRDTANSEHFVPGAPFGDGTTTSVAPVSVNGEITITIANAGASKVGSIYIYYR